MKQVIFTGAATALVTPFDKNGDISWGEIERLVEFQIEGGIDAIVACGTTGEAATIPNKEQEKLPVAGGMGAIWFSAGGLALASAAALLYFKQRKKGEE